MASTPEAGDDLEALFHVQGSAAALIDLVASGLHGEGLIAAAAAAGCPERHTCRGGHLALDAEGDGFAGGVLIHLPDQVAGGRGGEGRRARRGYARAEGLLEQGIHDGGGSVEGDGAAADEAHLGGGEPRGMFSVDGRGGIGLHEINEEGFAVPFAGEGEAVFGLSADV